MEEFTVVLVVLFCGFFLGCPIIGALTARRRRQANAADPGPKDLYRARRKLSTVTTFSVVNNDEESPDDHSYRRPWWLLGFSSPVSASSSKGRRKRQQKRDVEAGAAQLDLGECPICIGPLVPEPAHKEDGLNAREILDQVTTLRTTAGGSAPTADRQATSDASADAGPGEGTSSRTSHHQQQQQGSAPAAAAAAVAPPHSEDSIAPAQTHAEGEHDEGDRSEDISPWSRYRRQWTDRATARVKAGEDDILSLNTCRHAFHAKCLASWFLINRYDCPVCRTVYFVKRRPSLPLRAMSAAISVPPNNSAAAVVGRMSPP